jgi:hypothetical protein
MMYKRLTVGGLFIVNRRANWQITAVLIAIALGGSIIASCQTETPSGGASGYRVATSATINTHAVDRPLLGQTNNDGTACFWITWESVRIALVWPAGYIARAAPLSIDDRNGNQIAVVGQRWIFGLGNTDGIAHNVLGCYGFLHAWPVATVGHVNPAGTRYSIATVANGADLLVGWGGLLHGQMNHDGTACTWIGEAENRTAMIWPQTGYTAHGTPLSVYDEKDTLVAVVGTMVMVSGAGGPMTVGRTVAGCPGLSRDWLVGHVVQD